jgi:hypothetical protein
MRPVTNRCLGIMILAVHWGNIPTWVAAIGTVGALFTALFQINRERSHRQRVEQRSEDERLDAQARLLAAYPAEEVHSKDGSRTRTSIVLINGSDEPVYGVVVGVVYIPGAAPHSLEEMMRCHHEDLPRWIDEGPGAPGHLNTPPYTTVSILPGGEWRVWLPRGNWGILSGRMGADIAFSDRLGQHWIQRANGKPEPIPVEPFEYFAEVGMHGPHDLQRPERFSAELPHLD